MHIAFAAKQPLPQPKNRPRFSRKALQLPGVLDSVKADLAALQLPPWQLDVDSHVNFAVHQITTVLARHAPLRKVAPRQTFIATATMELVEHAASVRRSVRRNNRFLKRCFLRVAFFAIQFASPKYRDFDCKFVLSQHDVYTSLGNLLWFLERIPDTVAFVVRKQIESRDLTRKITIAVSNDRDAYICQLAQQVVDSQDPKAFQQLWPAIKRLAPQLAKSGLAPLPMLQLADGSFAENFEDTGRRWCEHFSSIEHGISTSFLKILQKARHSRYGRNRVMPQLSSDCFVMDMDLEYQYLSLNASKAIGPDKVPPEVLKHCAPAAARISPGLPPQLASSRRPVRKRGTACAAAAGSTPGWPRWRAAVHCERLAAPVGPPARRRD